MKQIAQNKSRTDATTRRAVEARSFAHHYGSVKRSAAPERSLRVYPPLGWGVGMVLPHVRRVESKSPERLDAAHLARTPLTL